MSTNPRYRRVLLKLSGEGLMGPRDFGLDTETVNRFADEVIAVARMGVEVCLVIGGGNFFRGVSVQAANIERSSADYMGMLATVMNALAFSSVLEGRGAPAKVLSAIPMGPICESYSRARAVEHLEAGRIVIFAAGTGNPYFTTDTAATLRAVEMGCDALFKGTQVDGVYSADPKTVPDAQRFDSLTYSDVLARDLRVMDATAIALARENKVPILVFSIHNPGSFAEVVAGQGRFTVVDAGE